VNKQAEHVEFIQSQKVLCNVTYEIEAEWKITPFFWKTLYSLYLFITFSKMLQEYVHYIFLHLFTLKKIDAIDVVAVATHIIVR
jgi:hypothetical protein